MPRFAAVAVWTARQWPRVRTALLFWLGWIVLSLAPTANVLVQEAPFAERYGLLALAAVSGLLA